MLALLVEAGLAACGGSENEEDKKQGVLAVDTMSLKLNKHDGKGVLVIKNTGDATLNNLCALPSTT